MCVGTTTAIAIGAGAAAAGSITAAKIGSNAASNAAATQSASADKAMGVQNQVYQDQKVAQAPYQQLGQQALGRLSGMAPSTASFNPQNYAQGAPKPQMGSMASMGQQAPPPSMPQQQIQPMGQPAAAAAPGLMNAATQAMQGATGPMVSLRGPDGSVKQFPAGQADQIIQAFAAKGQNVTRVQ